MRIVLLGIALSTLLAFRAVLIAPFGLFEPKEFEYWFFIPGRDTGAVSVLLALWLLWNRRSRIAAVDASAIGLKYWIGAAALCSIYSWAVLAGAPSLLIPAFCVHLMILASVWGGRSGLRAVAMPCAALLLSFPPPDPLLAELIWRLQGLAAEGSNLLLSLGGMPVQIEGTELRLGEYAFVVIESCSGWRGIQILSIIGLAACELRSVPLPRALWVIFLAVPLGIGLNIARVCLVVLTKEEVSLEIFESHTPQGIVVLMIGSVILYLVAAWLQRTERRRVSDFSDQSSVPVPCSTRVSLYPAMFSLGLSVALSLLSFALPRIVEERERTLPRVVDFDAVHMLWRESPLDLDYYFPYSTVAHPQYHATFKRQNSWGGFDVVDLFIAYEMRDPTGLNRLPDTKLIMPANDWSIVSRESTRIWRLGSEGQRALLTREAESEFTYVVAWRTHDDGLIRESLKSLLGLDACGAFRGECFRTVLRVAVPILHNDDEGRARAETTADDFIRDFKDAFEALAGHE